MKIAIMQPYFLPYIGYFQLINAVDKFVIYDDVNYIKKGWINRNKILVNGQAFLFTIPLEKASQNKLICNTFLSKEDKWKEKLLRTIENNYNKAPYFSEIFPLIESIILFEAQTIATYNLNSIKVICNHLKIDTEIVPSSQIYSNQNLKGEERIIDICLKEQATTYYNPSGGVNLYNQMNFNKNNLTLTFHQAELNPYNQSKNSFTEGLSIIDYLMCKSNDLINI